MVFVPDMIKYSLMGNGNKTQKTTGATPRHILSVDQFDHQFVADLFADADHLASLTHRVLSPAENFAGFHIDITFYEPSTRTRKSFETAGFLLGLQVSVTENAGAFSSAIKGETLEDSIRVLSGYDPLCIILRHPEKGAVARAAAISPVPIINAGDGAGEHPTQALLDLFTIHREIGRIDDLNVLILGDCRYGRTTHSLVKMLSRQKNIHVRTATPEPLTLPEDLVNTVTERGLTVEESYELTEEQLAWADIVYVTRLQKERLPAEERSDFHKQYDIYRLTADRVRVMKPTARILHPLPRVGEIDTAVDLLPQAAYFKQAAYGVPLRMALLRWVLKDQAQKYRSSIR